MMWPPEGREGGPTVCWELAGGESGERRSPAEVKRVCPLALAAGIEA